MLNISRHEEVVKLVEAGLSYAEIGRRLGITRERVRQIAKPKPRPKKPDFPFDIMLTTSHVARLLSIHINTVRRWSNKGIIRAYRIGPRRDRRFRQEDIVRFLAELNVDRSNETKVNSA